MSEPPGESTLNYESSDLASLRRDRVVAWLACTGAAVMAMGPIWFTWSVARIVGEGRRPGFMGGDAWMVTRCASAFALSFCVVAAGLFARSRLARDGRPPNIAFVVACIVVAISMLCSLVFFDLDPAVSPLPRTAFEWTWFFIFALHRFAVLGCLAMPLVLWAAKNAESACRGAMLVAITTLLTTLAGSLARVIPYEGGWVPAGRADPVGLADTVKAVLLVEPFSTVHAVGIAIAIFALLIAQVSKRRTMLWGGVLLATCVMTVHAGRDTYLSWQPLWTSTSSSGLMRFVSFLRTLDHRLEPAKEAICILLPLVALLWVHRRRVVVA